MTFTRQRLDTLVRNEYDYSNRLSTPHHVQLAYGDGYLDDDVPNLSHIP